MIPSYPTVLKWIHANKVGGYAVAPAVVKAIANDPILNEEGARNLIDAVAADLGCEFNVVRDNVERWASSMSEVALELAPISCICASAPEAPAPTEPAPWPMSARQVLARVAIGFGAQGQRVMSNVTERVGGLVMSGAEWVGRKAMNGFSSDRSSRAITRDELLAFAFGSVERAPPIVGNEPTSKR